MVNLEYWLGQEVWITFRNGQTDSHKVQKCPENYPYYRIGELPYTIDGIYTPDYQQDIIKIEPMNKKERLKKQIQELQEELNRLENETQVPYGFAAETAYKFLSGDKDCGLDASYWGKHTQEGEAHWMMISLKHNPTDKDVIQLQKWIIESYRELLGL